MRFTSSLLASLLFVSSGAYTAIAEDVSYPRKELLVEPAEVQKALEAENVVLLDARPREEYEKGHIPGSRWIDTSQWERTFDPSIDAGDWSERIGALGITPQAQVVVYDDNSSKDAARVWWILRFWGLRDVRLLNGGWASWKAAEAPITEEIPEPSEAAPFPVKPTGQRLATKSSILNSLSDQSLQIIDARSESEFCGLDARKNRRAGAIPGAKNLEWSDLIDSQTQRFKSANELQTLFDEAGVELDKPAAAHCQSGGRSSVMAFAMELMGAAPVQNYYAGWSEWGNTDETPIVKPDAP
ncbi:sulfurtransferase [Candidatus Laterigemmans baculatus]|uniref:sulfurtransferase n=1 Tax=Candidatus Laterigemmans baculatus TaxID=2770505 RepID=UPI0013DCCC8D|nr:sulfurtransferase [Candidatus Laterigemmans baculatus]